MDKKTAGLIGAVAGLATMGVAHASIPQSSEALQPSSYADLLAPVPNAVEMLKTDDAVRQRNRVPEGGVQLADYGYYDPPAYYHHHHHHYRDDRAYYRREHHHHHHNSYVGIPGVGGVIVR
jgi:hypothetical protein